MWVKARLLSLILNPGLKAGAIKEKRSDVFGLDDQTLH